MTASSNSCCEIQVLGKHFLIFMYGFKLASAGTLLQPSPVPGQWHRASRTSRAASALPAPAPSCRCDRHAHGTKQPLTGCRKQPMSPQFLPQRTNRACLSLWTQLTGYRGALPPPCVLYRPQTELAPASEAHPNPAGCFRKTWLLLQGSCSAAARLSHTEENLIHLTLPSA